MILKRLYIENFLAHERTEINFAPFGITAFIGENGAGKSSILEAISYALTGTSYKGKAIDLVKWGRNEAKVILDILKDGNEYRIERKITVRGRKATTEGYLYLKENGVYRIYYQKNLNKNIPKITGFTPKIFFNTILVKQGDIEGLINLQPSKRSEIIKELLDITLYDLIAKKFGEIRKEIQSKMEGLFYAIENIDELKEEINKLEKEEAVLKSKLNIILEKYQEINKKWEFLKENRRVLENKLREINKKEQERAKLEESLKHIEKEIERLKEDLEDIQKKKAQLNEYLPFIKKLEELKIKLEKFNQLDNLKTRLEAVAEKIEKIKKLEEIVKNYSDLAKEYENNEKKLEEITISLKNLNRLKGNLSTQEERFKKLKEELIHYMNSCKNIASGLAKIKPIFKPLELNPTLINEYLRNVKTDIETKEKLLTEKQSELKRIEKEGKSLKTQKANIDKLEGECPTCLRPIDEHSKEEILKEIDKRLKELRIEYKNILSACKDITAELELLKKIKEQLEEFKRIYDLYKEKEKEFNELKLNIQKIKLEISKLENLEEEEKKIREFLKENREKYLAYKQAVEELRNLNKEQIEKEYSQLKKEIEKLSQETQDVTIETLKTEINELELKKEEYIKLKEYISQEEDKRKRLVELENKLIEINEKLKSLEKYLQEKPVIEAELEKVEKEIQKIERDLEEINKNIANAKSEYSSVKTLLESKKKELEEKLKVKQKLEEYKNKLKKAKLIEFALGKDGIQKYLIEMALYELPKITNELFSNFGFPFEQITLTENFDIKLKVPTFERRDRFVSVQSISGGQRIALALALRLALVQFLSTKAEFLILDEPTIHLDDIRRNELVNLLIQLKNQARNKGLIKQLIIVSHDTELKDTADNIYFVENGRVFTESVV